MATAAPLANAKKAAASQHELLDTLVGIVTKHASEQLIGVGTRLVSALLDVADPSLDARAVFLRVKSGNLLKENSYAYFHLAAEGLEKALRKEVQELAPRARATLISEAALSLVPFEEMDNRVAFDAISRPFEMAYATQIATLNVRLGFLLNRDILRIAQNPFRPETFLSVLNSAWQEFEPNVDAHPLIIPLLRPALLWDFGPMYDALCDALMNKGVQPGSIDSYNIRKTESAAAAKIKRAKHQAALAKQLRQFLADDDHADADFDAAIPMIPNLPQSAPAAGGWRPSGVQHVAADPAASAPSVAHPHFQQAPGQSGAAPYGGNGHGGNVHAGQHGGNVHQGPAHGGHFTGGYPHPGGHYMPGQPGQPGAYLTEPGHHAFHAAAGAVLGQAGYGQAPAPLLDMLRTLQARMPEHFSATPSAPGQARNTDVFYLPRLKESIPKGSLSRGDESTIDLLSKIFDTVFVDPNIPGEIRELIQFLQIPVLKAALVDKDFFFEEAHPARRMINLLSSLGMEQRKPDDPLFQAMQRSVDRVGQSDEQDNGAVFQEAVAELEESIKEEETFEVNAIAAPIAAALKQEKVTAAKRSASTAVAARVGSGEVVAVLETFLERKWTSVLTLAYTVEEDKPGAVNNAMRTMDDLIWSVKPKITHAARKELIGKLPGLLATLNKWLDIIKWEDADRLQFFAELAECHASIVRAPLDITPERQLEIAVEVAQEDAKRRLDKENAAADAVEEVVDEAIVLIESLERGAWMEFTQTDGSLRRAKLAWVSPLKTLYIFSLGARKESFSLPVEKLTAGVRNAKVKLVEVDGVVERALSEAMGAGAVNDSAMDIGSVAA
ncbi:MAG: DUF1631 family protein [Massilia sp.]